MFFLIRCVFWLSVVFSTIFAAQLSAPDHRQAHRLAGPATQLDVPAQNWIEAALSFVKRQALEHCAVTDCLSQKAAERHFAFPPQNVAPENMAQADVPLPPRRPVPTAAK
jgi:hypothetical protein